MTERGSGLTLSESPGGAIPEQRSARSVADGRPPSRFASRFAGRRAAACAFAAVFALLAAFAFSTEARAESYRIICNNGYWFVTNMYGFGYGDRRISCDESKPGWIFDWDGPHHIKWVYDGDRVVTPYTNPGSDVVRTAVREVQALGNTPPPVNQPLADGTNFPAYIYIPFQGAKHRAVRGADGHCYREERIRGGWRRSTSYGTDAEACRRASWNALHNSESDLPVKDLPVNPQGGTFPSGPVPITLLSTTLTLADTSYTDPYYELHGSI